MPKPFVKGDSRINRKGRPRKGQSLTEILSMRLDQKDASGVLKRQLIADALIEAALIGDVGALKHVFDRIDGRPRETIAFESADMKMILLEIFNE
jgi:hypothetical protein